MSKSAITGAAALKVPQFRSFLTARFFLTMSFQMQSVAVGWQVYNITHDPLALGMIGLAEAIPFLSLVLFAGHWADIYIRKKLISISVVLFVLCSATFLLFSVRPSLLPAVHPEYMFYLVFAFAGVARAIAGPSIQATLPQILKRELYANGAAWNSSFWQIAAVTGPALGGLIYGFAGQSQTYLCVLVLCLSSLFFFSRLPVFPPARQRSEPVFASLAGGLKFVYKQPVILGALSLDLFAVLFGGAVALLPVFANEILHTGPQGLGILRAAPSTGAVITALIVTRHAPMRNSGKILLAVVALFGLCMIGFALSDLFWLSFILLFLSGLFDGVSVLIRSTIIQLFTPDEMRGRVASVNSIFIGSSNEIGAFESGLMARMMGLIPSVVFGGSMTLVCTGIVSKLAPTLRKLHLEEHVDT
ncbi:MAG: MFS transporter [Bacteroidia bacterium]